MEKKRLIILSSAVLLALVAVFLPGFSELQEKKEENRQLKQRIDLLEAHNEELKTELFRMKNEPGYLERKAREKLGVIKKDEIIYRPGAENDR
ncbi:MAG: hypothetical protein GF408_04555 [Candidatus Omnitrophica bacterium]|nr:hypothetical protein [Candidatus Omnitrophota bacterium]